VLWRSCQDTPGAFSPDASRMITWYISTDGFGPSVVQVRRADGTVLRTYRAARGLRLHPLGDQPAGVAPGYRREAGRRGALRRRHWTLRTGIAALPGTRRPARSLDALELPSVNRPGKARGRVTPLVPGRAPRRRNQP
jgi:hypothetical protein